MLQLKIEKDGRQKIDSKPSNQLPSSTISTLDQGSAATCKLLLLVAIFQSNRKTKYSPSIQMLNNISNIKIQHPSKSFEIRDIQVKKVEELLLQLKRSVYAYCYLQKEEAQAKQNILVWSHEAEAIFSNSLNGNHYFQLCNSMQKNAIRSFNESLQNTKRKRHQRHSRDKSSKCSRCQNSKPSTITAGHDLAIDVISNSIIPNQCTPTSVDYKKQHIPLCVFFSDFLAFVQR